MKDKILICEALRHPKFILKFPKKNLDLAPFLHNMHRFITRRTEKVVRVLNHVRKMPYGLPVFIDHLSANLFLNI